MGDENDPLVFDLFEGASDREAKKDTKKKSGGFRLVVGDEVHMKMETGSIVDYVSHVLERLFEFKKDNHRDIIVARAREPELEKLGLGRLCYQSETTAHYHDIAGESLKFAINIIVNTIRPKVDLHILKDIVHTCIGSIAAKSTIHRLQSVFKGYLDSYSEKDGSDAWDSFFGNLTFARDEIREKYKRILGVYFKGMIHNMFAIDIKRKIRDPDYEFDLLKEEEISFVKDKMTKSLPYFNGFLIFTGEQNIGKSFFVNDLLPPELFPFSSTGVAIIPREEMISFGKAAELKGTVLINLEDLHEKQIKSLPFFIKTQLERESWSYRYLYDNAIRSVARRFTPIATTNYIEIIFDITGNRRVLPICLMSINRAINNVNRAAMWTYFFLQWKKEITTITDWYTDKENYHDFLDICSGHYGTDSE